MGNVNETKKKLLAITREMIGSSGIESVSMREIGKRVQLSRSAMYRHFRNKEDLLAAITAENFVILRNHIQTLINRIDEPVKIMEQIMVLYYDFGMKNHDFYQLMFGREWNKELYPEVYAEACQTFEAVVAYLIKAQEQKCIADKPARELAGIVFAFIHGLVELTYAGHKEPEKGFDDPYSLMNSLLGMLQV